MNTRHVIPVQANLEKVKRAPARGRSQNYMPPEAAAALEQAQQTQKTVVISQ